MTDAAQRKVALHEARLLKLHVATRPITGLRSPWKSLSECKTKVHESTMRTRGSSVKMARLSDEYPVPTGVLAKNTSQSPVVV